MLRLRARWNSVTSSGSPLDRAYVNWSKRRVRTSATKSPGCGSSDQTSRLKSLRSRLNDFGTSSSNTARPRRNARGSTRHRLEHAVGHAPLEFEGVDADERRGKRRLERLAARRTAAAGPRSSFGAGVERHRAVADDRQRRDALRRFRHEDIARRNAQLEVDRLQHEVARRELLLGVQRQTMQAFDRREAVLARGCATAGGRSLRRAGGGCRGATSRCGRAARSRGTPR